jgi:hypothetical protein
MEEEELPQSHSSQDAHTYKREKKSLWVIASSLLNRREVRKGRKQKIGEEEKTRVPMASGCCYLFRIFLKEIKKMASRKHGFE